MAPKNLVRVSSYRGRGVAWHGVAVLMRNDISPCLSSGSSSLSAEGNQQPLDGRDGLDKGLEVLFAKVPGGYSLTSFDAATLPPVVL